MRFRMNYLQRLSEISETTAKNGVVPVGHKQRKTLLKGELTSKPTNVFFFHISIPIIIRSLYFKFQPKTANFSPFYRLFKFCTNPEL